MLPLLPFQEILRFPQYNSTILPLQKQSSTAIKKLVNSGSMYLRAHISALSFQLTRLLRSSPSAEVNKSPLPDLMTAILYFLPLHSVQIRSTSISTELLCWSSFVSHISTIFDFSNMFTSMVHHSFTLSFGIIYLHYSFSHLPFICSFYCFFSSDASHISLNIAFIGDFSQKRRLLFWNSQGKTPLLTSQQMPKNRRALPVRGELAGGLTPAFFLQTKKGYGFYRFQRQAECRLRCLPVLRTDFRTAGLSVFSPSDISPNSLHVARQPHSTEMVG